MQRDPAGLGQALQETALTLLLDGQIAGIGQGIPIDRNNLLPPGVSLADSKLFKFGLIQVTCFQ